MARKGATVEQKAKKNDALYRIAERRVPNALKALRLVGNLANYRPRQDQKAAIIGALRDGLETVEARFAGKTEQEAEFSLPR